MTFNLINNNVLFTVTAWHQERPPAFANKADKQGTLYLAFRGN